MSTIILSDALEHFPDFPFKDIVIPVLAIILVISAIFFYITSIRKNLKKQETPLVKSTIDKTSLIPFERAEREKLLFKNSQNGDHIFIDDINQADELAQIITNHAVICVHGPAGIGKTTIVDEVRFTKLQDYFTLNFRVDFEDVHAPDSLEELNIDSSFERAKLRLLSGIGAVGQNADIKSIAQGYLVKTLLFVDNYEQIQACDELDLMIRKELIAPFIENPFVTTVFTSRILMKSDTKNFEVATLQNAKQVNGMSSIDLAHHFPAIRLFFKEHNQFATNNNLERKNYSPEDCEIIIKLCDLVSCLPLGIQLIASRSCEQSLTEIFNSFQIACQEERPIGWSSLNERHKSLFNAFYWSFNLLNDEEKELCAHLSLFKNGFFESTIPTWELYSDPNAIKKVLKKLNEHSILRKSKHSGEIRFELYVFASEMLIAGIKERNFKFKQGFILNVGKMYLQQIEKATRQIFNEQNAQFDYTDLVENIRYDIENIQYFSKHLFEIGFSSLVTEILCSLEKILFEVGPYVLLKDSFQNLLSSDKLNQKETIKANLSYARIIKSTRARDDSWRIASDAFTELRKLENTFSEAEISEAYVKLTYIAEGNQRKELLESYSIEEKNSDEVLQGIMHQLQGRYDEANGDFEHAKKEFEIALNFLESYPLHFGKALNYSGLFYWREGYPSEAKNSFIKAIETYEKIGAKRWVQGFKTNLALLAADSKEFTEGFKYCNEAEEELRKEGPFEWYQINKHSLARLTFRSDNSEESLESAKSVLTECSKVFKEIKYGESLVLCLADLAEVLFKQEKYEESLSIALNCIQVADENSISKMMRVFRANMMAALASHELKMYSDFIKYKDDAIEILNSVPQNKWLTYSNTKTLYTQIIELNEELH